jgi:hypothetical protein
LAAGAQKNIAAGTSLTVGGTLLTLVQIVAKLNGFAALRSDVDAARAALQAKLAVETAQAVAMNAFISAFVKIVRGMFGSQPDVLADFGLQAPKAKTPLTVEQKAAAAAKRKATRAARGTTGSKQKQSIKGNVTGVTVTPVTAPPAAPPVAADGTSGTNAPANTKAPGAPATMPPQG